MKRAAAALAFLLAMLTLGQALAAGETEGLVRLVVDAKYGEILGAHFRTMLPIWRLSGITRAHFFGRGSCPIVLNKLSMTMTKSILAGLSNLLSGNSDFRRSVILVLPFDVGFIGGVPLADDSSEYDDAMTR